MKKVNFNELEKMSYETGKEFLLSAGYVQKNSAVDEKEDYSINDEYYTLFNEEDEIIHEVSYVTYTKNQTNDEPIYINEENNHWSEIPQ